MYFLYLAVLLENETKDECMQVKLLGMISGSGPRKLRMANLLLPIGQVSWLNQASCINTAKTPLNLLAKVQVKHLLHCKLLVPWFCNLPGIVRNLRLHVFLYVLSCLICESLNLQLVILGASGDDAVVIDLDNESDDDDLESNVYWRCFQDLRKVKDDDEQTKSRVMSEFLVGCKALDPEGPGCWFYIQIVNKK